MSFFLRCFSHIFAIANQWCLSISRSVNVEYFCKYVSSYKYFLNVSINVSLNDYSFKYICVVRYLKPSFSASPVLQCLI